MAFVKNRWIIPFFLSIGFASLYIHNLSQSVYGGDVGDLITAAAVHGVPHAPGYPLFTFLGFLLIRFIPFFTPAGRIGLISALSSAVGIAVFYLMMLHLTKRRFVSILSSLILGCVFFYWFYAEIAEVFGLHSLFILLVFYFSILYNDTQKKLYGFLLFFTFGLACINQQTIIFLVPSIGFLIFPALWKLVKKQKKVLLFYVFFFILGFFPYIYIPLASATRPVINWDNVQNVQSFLHLLLRKDYGSFSAGPFSAPTISQRMVILKVYFSYLVTQLTIPVVLVSLVGLCYLCRKKNRIFLAIAAAFIISGPLFLVYAGFPVTTSFLLGVYERFFLMPSLIFFIPFAFGLLVITEKLGSIFPKNRHYALLFQIVFLFIPIALFFYNFPKTDLSHVMTGDTVAKDLLTPLPPHAVLLVSGDTVVFNTWYVHYALHVRPDVLVYNIGGGIMEPDLSAALFTNGKKNKESLEDTLIKMNAVRPVFSNVLFQSKKGEKITWVPYGLVYKMVLQKDPLPDRSSYAKMTDGVWSKMHIPNTADANKAFHDYTIAGFPDMYADSLAATASFFFTQYQDDQTALRYYQKALSVSPDNAKIYETIGVFYLSQKNNCKNVISNLSTAISLNPFEELPYFLLYNAYQTCGKNQKAADAIKTQFNRVFQLDFAKELKKNKTKE